MLDSKGAEPVALTTQRDDGVIAVFRLERQSSSSKSSQFFLERLTSTGELDRNFGERGVARLRLKGMAGAVTIAASNGHVLVVVGERRSMQVVDGEKYLVLAEYTSTGHLDRHFGGAGMTRSSIPDGSRYFGVSPRAIAFDASGNAIVVGQLNILTVDTPAGDGFIARYAPNGRDFSFGAGGIVVDERFGAANAVAVQPDGRIVVAGWGRGFLAARYMGGDRTQTCPSE